MELQTGAATVENTMEAQNTKNRITLWPNNLTSGYLPEEIQNADLKIYVHFYVHCSIIYNSLYVEAT